MRFPWYLSICLRSMRAVATRVLNSGGILLDFVYCFLGQPEAVRYMGLYVKDNALADASYSASSAEDMGCDTFDSLLPRYGIGVRILV